MHSLDHVHLLLHDSHHHADLSLFDWIKNTLQDLYHHDLGEDHLETFLHSEVQYAGDLLEILDFPIPFLELTVSGEELEFPTRNGRLFTNARSFSDPPFLEASGSRGPPTLS